MTDIYSDVSKAASINPNKNAHNAYHNIKGRKSRNRIAYNNRVDFKLITRKIEVKKTTKKQHVKIG